MTDTKTAQRAAAATLIRNEPVQARSTARLAALLDAAAEVVDEIGYERLTTAMVADRAGASIGTVYRYFPDRIAVLHALAARHAERTTSRVLEELRSEAHADWAAGLSSAFEIFVEAFRHEPGFASLRLGDTLDLRPREERPAYSVLADQLFDGLVERYGVDGGDEARAAFESALVMSDAIAAHAFLADPKGSEVALRHGQAATLALLSPYWGNPLA
ncbi:TetR/AcrR family transcriptional regulator [Homoserinibacter sp. YIM 151385]|uniref:TetR/AcrR family transcriptional regulator n=1 Tax=Homoserinibacter sp. YIM 151385 TaxID=2985506 RepID=UPI0022F0AF67|nr:TetR/AcrR family transcriptional regulator [Homoserinibacter sp. YIM 151385]WBU38956.1 TetR/AcrR family transcriptional regulator [Homoserinibacter sp. YIM 151385]